MTEELDITPSPRVLQILGEIPFEPWQCIAELVDNSFDELVKQTERTPDNPLKVNVEVHKGDGRKTFLEVSDNGSGMDRTDLERSLRAGHSGKYRYGTLGLFGMGFNIATARLGSITTVTTQKLGDDFALRTTIDFAALQRDSKFTVPLDVVKAPLGASGTQVRIELKRDYAELFDRKEYRRGIAQKLGDVYSFLLRDGVPGLAKPELSAKIPAKLMFCGDEVQAKLPCVWSDERFVTSRGEKVHAIQYIDVSLTAATACLDCGYWDNNNGPVNCEECDSTNLEKRERRIWGWIGIQRYIDDSKYGIDFIRYGRKIVMRDKALFTYTNPETLDERMEYPIEQPANKGRIVGEIHLDHVPVVYQKNDFNRQLNSWQTAMEQLRGSGPLYDAKHPNGSPLAQLYSAFRRNDPGLRYLTAGDGQKAIHSKTKEWGDNFEKGIERFRSDAEWYEAAARHDAQKSAPTTGGPDAEGVAQPSTPTRAALFGQPVSGNLTESPANKPAPALQTRESMIQQAKLLGTNREDLSGTFKLGKELGDWQAQVWVTRERLAGPSGEELAVMPGDIQGHNLEILVASEHPIFKDFGRDIRDVALLQTATLIVSLSSVGDATSPNVYAEMVKQIPDLRTSANQILERIENTISRLRSAMLPVIKETPDLFWNELAASQKADVEQRVATYSPELDFLIAVETGEFALYLGADAMATILASRPFPFFDGVVFKPLVVGRPENIRQRVVAKTQTALMGLHEFQTDELLRQADDLKLVQLQIDQVNDSLVSDEFLR